MKRIRVSTWLKALRSGKYEQGKGQLYDQEKNAYCVLGVGAALTGQECLGLKAPLQLFLYDLPKPMQLGHSGVVVPARFLPENKPRGNHYHSVTYLNDRLGMSFSEIADVIERVVAYHRGQAQ